MSTVVYIMTQDQIGDKRLPDPIMCQLTDTYMRHQSLRACLSIDSQIAKFMGPTWGPSGSCRPQMSPMWAPWTLLSKLSSNLWRLTMTGPNRWQEITWSNYVPVDRHIYASPELKSLSKYRFPDSKVHGANMGTIWVLSAPDEPYVGPVNLAIKVIIQFVKINNDCSWMWQNWSREIMVTCGTGL